MTSTLNLSEFIRGKKKFLVKFLRNFPKWTAEPQDSVFFSPKYYFVDEVFSDYFQNEDQGRNQNRKGNTERLERKAKIKKKKIKKF